MSVSTMLLYTLLAICLSLCHGSQSSQGELQSLTKAGYDQLESASGIQVIHFHGARRISPEVDLDSEIPDHTANEDRAVRMFYVQYKKAVAALAPYDVQLYIVNCEKEDIKEYCTKDKVHTNVYIFRQGSELLSLGLDSMFDVDAIVSNILQITLLREVPILQSQTEREEYENQYKGYHDIIFSFQVAIGTKDHRLLMEVAHEYKDRYKWAITTEKKTTDGLPDIPVDDDTAAIWLLRCKDSPMTMTLAMKSCPSVAYQSKMTRRQVSEFLDNIPVSKVHVLDEGVISAPPFTSGLANVLIFIDDTEHEFVTESANEILSTFRGSIDMFIVNEKKVDAAMLSILTGRHIPCLAIQLSQDSELVFMSEDEEPDNFIKNQLNKMSGKGGDGQNVHRLESMDDDDEGYGSEAEEDEYSKYLSEVERQDDEVAMAMARFRGQITNDDSLLALTDKTFPTETTDRDLLLVLFYLPFDAMSSAVHRSFVMAADTLVKKNMSNPLSAVNCFDWTDVCGREKVTTWPTLRVYKKGQEMRTHKMVISPENIIYAISLFEIDAPVELESFQQLMKPMREVPPGTDRKLDVVILGLAENEYDQDTKLITDAALELHGTHIVYLAVGEVAKEIEEKTQTPKSMMLVARKGDQYLSHSKAPLKDFESTEHLVRWVKESAIFIYAELTPTNLPVIFGRKIPVVIFFTNDPNPGPYEGTNDLLGKIAGSQKLKNFVFTFMNKFEDRTKKVMMSYVGDSTDDVLTVLDHVKGHVYVYEGDLLSQPSMETWFKAIEAGEITHKTTLPKGDWKPKVAPYDFLQMMDDDKRREKKDNRDDNQMSHDLGDEEDLDGSDIGRSDGSMSDESQFSDIEPEEYRTHPDLNDDLYMPPDDLELFKEKYGLGRDSFTLTDEQYEDFQSIVKERREERMNENEKKKKEKMEKMEKMKNKNRVEL